MDKILFNLKIIAEEFPGIYAMKFPQNCWSLDNKRILINSQWKRANVKYLTILKIK